MLTMIPETTSSMMGSGSFNGEQRADSQEQHIDELFPLSNQIGRYNPIDTKQDLVFFAGTDKARVISEILESRGWSRTKDLNVTNFTIKWCLAHQVDWNKFQEGKQLINNIPGQLAFADKINLWYTIKEYLNHRRTADGNYIQAFLPMTFVLDDENEVNEFLRCTRRQTRTWICKPRYSFAGRGIYVISGSNDLNTIFKLKLNSGNRLQYQPRLPGYLMQEYIARPLLIKGRKFDIRVHWLVAWTKPLLVFYNHNASAVRLSLNLYREFDFDRATHLTNLSVQEHHTRYALCQEATGMTMQQLNHYFNQCFRPFHPRMCQDWVMTVMQERMQTIIRHVIRASRHKLTRSAGQFGFFGCDFLLDENFRIWLLEINDNPGVGWGNSRLNTTTKPLFEETLNIVFECFEKFKNQQSLLPINCLRNYQLIYNEDDDMSRAGHDDNQIIFERLSLRYSLKDSCPKIGNLRSMQKAREIIHSNHQNENEVSDSLPSISGINEKSSSVESNPLSLGTTSSTPLRSLSIQPMTANDETIEPLKHQDDIELERLMKTKPPKPKSPVSTSRSTNPLSNHKTTKSNIKRVFSSNNLSQIQRRKRIDLSTTPMVDKRQINRSVVMPKSTETTNKTETNHLNQVSLIEKEKESINPFDANSILTSSLNLNSSQNHFL